MGVTPYELLTGELPFDGDNIAELTQKILRFCAGEYAAADSDTCADDRVNHISDTTWYANLFCGP